MWSSWQRMSREKEGKNPKLHITNHENIKNPQVSQPGRTVHGGVNPCYLRHAYNPIVLQVSETALLYQICLHPSIQQTAGIYSKITDTKQTYDVCLWAQYARTRWQLTTSTGCYRFPPRRLPLLKHTPPQKHALDSSYLTYTRNSHRRKVFELRSLDAHQHWISALPFDPWCSASNRKAPPKVYIEYIPTPTAPTLGPA